MAERIQTNVTRRIVQRSWLLLALGLCVAAFAGVQASEAGAFGEVGVAGEAAEWNVSKFNVYPSTTQAGGHPDVVVEIATDSHGEKETADPCQCNDLKDADLEMPAGLIGNPHAAATCSDAQFLRKQCAADSQIGEVRVKVDIGGEWPNAAIILNLTVPLFNMIPKPSQAGLAAWTVPVFELPIFTVFGARTGTDYGLNAFTDGVQHTYSILETRYEFWGVPADPSHDARRTAPNEGGLGSPSDLPPVPFLQSPTTCTGPLSTTGRLRAYNRVEHVVTSPWPATTGCDQLSFNPSLSAQPTTTATDTPSGLEVDLSVPQELSPTTPSPSEIRAVSTTLPEGFSINPNAADGKTSCTDEEASFGTLKAAACPEYSKVGTTSILSSALPGPLPGGIYLGKPLPGNRYRIFITGDGYATHLKLAGTATLDPNTGRITTTFNELPQSPLTEINFHFFGSERGLLATPTRCGTYAVHTTFTPWDGALASQDATQLFTLNSGPGGTPCPGAKRPFDPGFRASSLSNTAGAHTPFSINLSRKDGDQNLSAISVSTPPGLLATLAGVPYCSEAALAAASQPGYSGLAEQASPSCPAASQIGTSVTGAGAGPHPLYVPGKVFLAGPYKGAPLSLAVVTPAVSGPYDLGNVTVRAALKLDPVTARITAISDPLPSILEGIPLRVRSVLVSLDRPNFTLNPTNCEPHAVAASANGDEGADASMSAGFQVSNCAILPFAPKLAIKLSGGTKRAQNPALEAIVTAPAGSANIATTVVTLPHSEFLDNTHIQAPCTRVQFAKDQCPAKSVLGHAKAESPLLDAPLAGPVYLRTSTHPLPDIVVVLEGQVKIELVGRIDSVKGQLRTTFAPVPDAAISKFTLNLNGDKKGLLENSTNICAAQHFATAKMVGQNGRSFTKHPKLQVRCGSKSQRKNSKRSERGGSR
jgi:hypothetical protein